MTLLLPKPTSSLEKVQLLLWKNFLLQKRHYIQTAFDVFLPVAFIFLFVGIGGRPALYRAEIVDTNLSDSIEIDSFDW